MYHVSVNLYSSPVRLVVIIFINVIAVFHMTYCINLGVQEILMNSEVGSSSLSLVISDIRQSPADSVSKRITSVPTST